MILKDLKIGDKYISQGLDMQCRPCEVECQLISVDELNRPIILSEGIKIIMDWESKVIRKLETK